MDWSSIGRQGQSSEGRSMSTDHIHRSKAVGNGIALAFSSMVVVVVVDEPKAMFA